MSSTEVYNPLAARIAKDNGRAMAIWAIFGVIFPNDNLFPHFTLNAKVRCDAPDGARRPK